MEKVLSPKSPLCVVYGSEEYHLDTFVTLAKSWTNREVRVANEGATESDVLDLLEMSSERSRTIIVDNAQSVKESKSKPLRAYIEDRSATDFHVVLVAVVRDPKVSALWEWVGGKGKVFHYPKLKALGEGKSNEVLKYIRDRATTMNLSLDVGIDLDLFKFLGTDLYKINSELRKLEQLATITNDRKVTRKQIALVVSPVITAQPWDIAEAAFGKNSLMAMNLLSQVYRGMGDEASVPITAALVKELQKVIVARHLLDSGVAPDELAGLIEMHPYPCKEFFLPRVRKHDSRTLAEHMSRLCKLDSDVKGPSRSKRTLVELAVLSIAR